MPHRQLLNVANCYLIDRDRRNRGMILIYLLQVIGSLLYDIEGQEKTNAACLRQFTHV